MKILTKYKIDKCILIPIMIFIFISLISIYSAQSIIDNNNSLLFRQIIWYIIGFLLIIILMHFGNDFLFKYAWFLYILGNFLLLVLLFIGREVNNAKCWLNIPGIGTFQPSEFMKIFLIIILGKLINDFTKKNPNPSIFDEFKFLIKIGFVILIPSTLTFLEPDTGVVLIYLLITIIMLFISGIRYRWFIILISLLMICTLSIVIIYKIDQDLFINLFGTSFFLRVDRLLDWKNGSGYQLSNSLMSIGSANFFGHGLNNTPLYFPEAHTDFIFAIYASNFGFLGAIILFGTILFFDIKLINIATKSKNNINKYMISGIVGMLIYQQFQNIGMTYGLLPITGITLPFISYGGSSLLSYMLMLGIIFNISNDNYKKMN